MTEKKKRLFFSYVVSILKIKYFSCIIATNDHKPLSKNSVMIKFADDMFHFNLHNESRHLKS